MFNKFKDSDGRFKESLAEDVSGLLSLYEATHVRTRGEELLDEALIFTTTHLESATHRLSTCESKHVDHALYQPLWKGVPRLEARQYLSAYPERDSRNEIILNLAKLDFNLLQQIHRKELSNISRSV